MGVWQARLLPRLSRVLGRCLSNRHSSNENNHGGRHVDILLGCPFPRPLGRWNSTICSVCVVLGARLELYGRLLSRMEVGAWIQC